MLGGKLKSGKTILVKKKIKSRYLLEKQSVAKSPTRFTTRSHSVHFHSASDASLAPSSGEHTEAASRMVESKSCPKANKSRQPKKKRKKKKDLLGSVSLRGGTVKSFYSRLNWRVLEPDHWREKMAILVFVLPFTAFLLLFFFYILTNFKKLKRDLGEKKTNQVSG